MPIKSPAQVGTVADYKKLLVADAKTVNATGVKFQSFTKFTFGDKTASPAIFFGNIDTTVLATITKQGTGPASGMATLNENEDIVLEVAKGTVPYAVLGKAMKSHGVTRELFIPAGEETDVNDGATTDGTKSDGKGGNGTGGDGKSTPQVQDQTGVKPKVSPKPLPKVPPRTTKPTTPPVNDPSNPKPDDTDPQKKPSNVLPVVKVGVTPEHKQKGKELLDRINKLKTADPDTYQRLTAQLTTALDNKKQLTSAEIDTQLAQVEKALDDWKAPVKGGVTPPKLSPQQQKKKEGEAKQKQLEAETEMAVLRAGMVLSPDIISIMNEHKAAVPAEKKHFEGIRFIEDIFVIKDEGKRKTTILGINASLETVKDRRQRMGDAINNNPIFQSPDQTNLDPVEIEESMVMCRKFWSAMSSHIPDEFDLYLKERDFGARVKAMEKTAGKTAAEKRQIIDAAKTVSPQDQQSEKNAFLDAIGHGSLKPAEMTAFYFDEPVRPITADQQKKLYEANEKIIARAHQIHDLGGSVADVEASLAHIPEEFWPPQFIEELQAWRKVEREMAEERVAELFADKKKLTKLEVFTAVTGAAGLVGDVMSLVGGCSDLAKGVSMAMQYEDLKSLGVSDSTIKDSKAWDGMLANHTLTQDQYDALKEYKGINGPLEGPKLGSAEEQIGKDVRMVVEDMKDLTKGLNPLIKALAQEGKSLKEQLDGLTAEEIVMMVSKLASVVSKLKNIGAISTAGEAGAVFAKNFCPVLGAVASGLDMVSVGMTLKRVAQERQVALQQLENVDLDYFSGKETDKAMVNALINEKGARNRQTTKKSVEFGAKVIIFAGDSVAAGQMGDPTGATTATGAALKILGKTIELGNKVVFSGIDWSIAKKAMALLEEAQAGNPVARVEIFKDCGLYAKMYICCAARDGSPVAKQYIIDRGLTEDDLTKPMGLKILREKLLKKSEQKDESKNTNLGGVMVEGLTSAETRNVGKRMIGAIGDGVTKVAKKIKEKFPGPTYVAGNWTPPSSPTLSKSEWHAQKDLAEKNGLHLDKVGLGDAMEKFTKAEDDATALVQANGTSEEEKKKCVEAIAKVIECADKVHGLIGKLDPVTNDGAPYPEMIDYLATLRSMAGAKSTEWNKKLYLPSIGGKTADWKPVATIELTVASWTANWNDAAKKCMLSEDGNAGNRMKDFEAATTASDLTSKNAAKVRKANLAIRDELKNLADALNVCASGAGEFEPVVGFINDLLTLIVKRSQKLNSDLATAKWDGGPTGKNITQLFTPTGWKGVFDSAVAEGYAEGGDQGMEDALKSLEKADAVLNDPNMKDGEAVGKARAKVIGACVSVAKAVGKLRQKNAETHKDFRSLLTAMEKEAHRRCGAARAEFAKVSFTQVGGELTKKNWNATYEEAVSKGAISKDDDARKKLADAVSTAEDAESTYAKESNPEKKFKAAGELQKALKAVQMNVQFVGGTPGFENPTLKKYLATMDTWAKQKLDDADFKKVVTGEVDDKDLQLPSAFAWSHKSWTGIKAQAVKLGLVGSKQTGLGKLLDESDEAFQKWQNANDADKPDKRDKAMALLEATIKAGAAAKPKAATGKLKDYLALFETEAQRRKTALG